MTDKSYIFTDFIKEKKTQVDSSLLTVQKIRAFMDFCLRHDEVRQSLE